MSESLLFAMARCCRHVIACTTLEVLVFLLMEIFRNAKSRFSIVQGFGSVSERSNLTSTAFVAAQSCIATRGHDDSDSERRLSVYQC